MALPLDGLLVLDFAQFLAGPAAALRLADLGARVIKIERPDGGEAGRGLKLADLSLDDDSLLFHTVNRNKQGVTANLKDPADLERVMRLVARADVLIQNFRPTVMARLGLDYPSARARNPRLIYGTVTGYGSAGPWAAKPGQDLLAQSLSGLPWLTGDRDDPPTAFGLSVADLLAAAHLTQGILACLVRRGSTGEGGLVEISLMESILDLQFESFTTYLNDRTKLPIRGAAGSASAYLGAPYGIYPTADGFVALAMCPIPALGRLLGLPALLAYEDPASWFDSRDEIKAQLASRLATRPTADWLEILEPADVWCADVLTWPRLLEHEGFRGLEMVQRVSRANGASLLTTRCPIRIDGQILTSPVAAPSLGEHNAAVWGEGSPP